MSSLKPKIIIPNGLSTQTQTIFVPFISLKHAGKKKVKVHPSTATEALHRLYGP
jgi:hypothetical protein